MRAHPLALALTLFALSSCAYRPGDVGIDNPFYRKVAWFSFVEGEDIKSSCAPGRDHYRLVYNGNYEEQVRIYEIQPELGGRAAMNARVLGSGNLTKITSDDFLAPWRGKGAQTMLNQSDSERLVKSLEQGGAFGPPAVGLEMRSEEHFWTAATCRDGRYTFTAWLFPSPRYDAMGFDKVLLALDTTGVAYNPPRRFIPTGERDNQIREGGVISFRLKVGKQGLAP